MIMDDLSLRDYFATHAPSDEISEIVSTLPIVERIFDAPNGGKQIIWAKPIDAVQQARYIYADRMIEVRKNRG
jgi:hypothetical protein